MEAQVTDVSGCGERKRWHQLLLRQRHGVAASFKGIDLNSFFIDLDTEQKFENNCLNVFQGNNHDHRDITSQNYDKIFKFFF